LDRFILNICIFIPILYVAIPALVIGTPFIMLSFIIICVLEDTAQTRNGVKKLKKLEPDLRVEGEGRHLTCVVSIVKS
jgi:hypothetical protein